jgi:hypothetical protein
MIPSIGARRMAPKRMLVAALAACALCLSGTARAQPVSPANADTAGGAAKRRGVSFSPKPYARCDVFFVTEFSANLLFVEVDDQMDRFLFTDSFGLMKNLTPDKALGGSFDLHVAQGVAKYAVTVRYKQWLGERQSVDLSLGFFPDDAPGIVGPIANLRYSPAQSFYVQAGLCQIKEQWGTYVGYPEYFRYHEARTFRVYGGIGCGGVPGVVLWGAQMLGIGVVGLLVFGFGAGYS